MHHQEPAFVPWHKFQGLKTWKALVEATELADDLEDRKALKSLIFQTPVLHDPDNQIVGGSPAELVKKIDIK